MALCDEIRLLLGPFEDGELEPHEMEDVAFHVVGCAGCKRALDDFKSIGVALRDISPQPGLDSFADSVISRIERIKVPLGVRLERYIDRFAEHLGSAGAIGSIAAAAAVLTIMLVTPYARQLVKGANHDKSSVAEIAAVPTQTQIANQSSSNVNQIARGESAGNTDSPPVISRLEANSPSVAVWSEPQNGTTVIWVPDQP
jgi:hypothetical protein